MDNIVELPKDFEAVFINALKIYDFMGINILNDKKGFWRRHLRFIIFITLFMSCFVNQLFYVLLYKNLGAELVDVMYVVTFFLMGIQDIVKTFVILLKRNKLKILIIEIAKLWPEKKKLDAEKRYNMEMWMKRGKIFNIVFTIYSCSGLTFIMIPSYTLALYRMIMGKPDPYLLPITMYLPWDTNSMFWFFLLSLYQTFVGIQLMILFMASDILLVALTGSISMLLNLLQIDIENCITDIENTDNLQVVRNDDCEGISEIVANHQKCLKVAEQLNDIFGLIVFDEIFISGIVICLYSFTVLVLDRSQICLGIAGVFGNMLAILNYAWPGELLYEMSSNVAHAAYNCKWYDKEPRFRRYILLMIARAQRPCYISAFGFANVLLLTFSKTLSTAWSYFSLLNQIYGDSDI